MAWNGIGYQVQIGHATSPHPDSAWTKDPNNPVLIYELGKWDYPRVQSPCVIYDGNIFHMWYSGGQTLEFRIGYATSEDGSHWDKFEPNPVLEVGSAGSWDDTFVGFCSVIDSAGSRYKMWYTGGNEAGEFGVGYAYADAEPDALEEIVYGVYPDGFDLKQNYPNPFNPSTTIEFTLPKSEFIELKFYNILGKEVSKIVSKKLNPGNYTYTFDGKNLASGVYYYQLVAGDYREVKKMILLK
jgi:hypothetical protein